MSDNLTPKESPYPTLAEMGIVRFHEISHYSLRQDAPDSDVLRIIYKRAKGSLLPYSRKYKFGRSQKTAVADGGTSRMEHIFEISPFLLRAVKELDALVELNKHDSSHSSPADLKSDLIAEIDELKQLVTQSVPSDNLAAVQSKIDSLQKHIEAI